MGIENNMDNLGQLGLRSRANSPAKNAARLRGVKSIEKKIKEDKSRLKDAMQACGVKSWTTPNGYKITLVPDGEDEVKKKFNESKLKESDPETYNKYLEDTIVKGKSGYVRITAPKKEG